MKTNRGRLLISLLLMMCFLIGCTEKEATPESVAGEFWQAVIDKDMEKAKNMATWDSVDYLKYIRSGQLKPERYELGEVMKSDRAAIIETMLYSQPEGTASVKIPGKTALVSTEHGWRVDLKQTIGSTLKETVGTVFDQLNGLMQEGLKGFDKQLSDSVKEIGKALEKSAEELRDELSKQPFNNRPQSDLTIPEGQRI
ncbi:MAG: hypothetical protein ACPG47_08850 [Leucothrix sp.]